LEACNHKLLVWQSKHRGQSMEARARIYTIISGNLYKKGVVQPLLRCISQTEGMELLHKIHGGICGSQIGPQALSAKALR
jgi:hypothetical protein